MLRISTGNTAEVYVSDILRIYTTIVSNNRPLTEVEIDQLVKGNCRSRTITPFVIPLIAPFSDIEISKEPKYTIKFISLWESNS